MSEFIGYILGSFFLPAETRLVQINAGASTGMHSVLPWPLQTLTVAAWARVAAVAAMRVIPV